MRFQTIGISRRLLQLFFCGLVFFVAYVSYSEQKTKIVLTGSSTVAPLVLEISKAFEKEQKGVRVDVQTGGSSRGVADAKKGLADIGMASRGLKPKEANLFSHTIAVDGVAPLVHASNPIKNITKLQFKDILLGKVKNWKDVGGNDAPIVVVNRAEGRSELELVTGLLDIEVSVIKATMIVGENAHGIKTVSKNKNAITYMSIGHAIREMELGIPIRMPKFEGVEATIESVKKGEFPLARPLNLITKTKPSGIAKVFIEFARSTKVKKIVEDQRFIPTTN
ncbi:MAG: phosphate ABC transporter substrate-binding protein [Oligoflexales bacterium]|nr:phosphate ABC transporter substrate-binding protein [Oligoflexales bacterium]